MSGPVTAADAPVVASLDALHQPQQALPPTQQAPTGPQFEITDSRETQVGRFQVRRALPCRGRRTVGAWCFADHLGPASVTEGAGLDVGPHPHIGLQTVTWLVSGEALHRDSLGSEQVIKAGELNLMTAGAGVAHSEEATGSYRGELAGVQLWIAQPEGTRHTQAAFEHHAVLPQLSLPGVDATLLIGEFAGDRSPARIATRLAGVDLEVTGAEVHLPLNTAWEYALVVLEGELRHEGALLTPAHLGYLGAGRDEMVLWSRPGTRALLVGGEPFSERILMWWNFVARSTEELAAAYDSWRRRDGRFGCVQSALQEIPAPQPYWG